MVLELKYKTDHEIGTKKVTQGLQYIYEYKTMWISFDSIEYALDKFDGEGFIRTKTGDGFMLDAKSYGKVTEAFKLKSFVDKGGV